MSNEILIFEKDGQSVDVRLDAEQETLWLTQKQMAEVFSSTPENIQMHQQMAEVFSSTPENIQMHLKNIFKDSELDENPTTKDFLVVRTEGKRQVK